MSSITVLSLLVDRLTVTNRMSELVNNAFLCWSGSMTFSVLRRTPHETNPAGATHCYSYPDSLEAGQGRKRDFNANTLPSFCHSKSKVKLIFFINYVIKLIYICTYILGGNIKTPKCTFKEEYTKYSFHTLVILMPRSLQMNYTAIKDRHLP